MEQQGLGQPGERSAVPCRSRVMPGQDLCLPAPARNMGVWDGGGKGGSSHPLLRPAERCSCTASPNLPAHLLELPLQLIRILGGTGEGGTGAQKPQDTWPRGAAEAAAARGMGRKHRCLQSSRTEQPARPCVPRVGCPVHAHGAWAEVLAPRAAFKLSAKSSCSTLIDRDR